MKKRLISMFLAVLMLMSVTSVASASAASDLSITARHQSNQTIVEPYLTGYGITNGRIEVTYDPALVTLVDVIPADGRWITSVDKDTDGLVSFAWVGSNINSTTKLVILVFEAANNTVEDVTYTVNATELYASGEKVALPGEASVTISDDSASDSTPEDPDVVIPLPDQPNPPVLPGEGEGGSGSGSVSDDDHPFTDIDGHWAEDAIISAYKAGLFNGTGDGTTFSPNMPLNRAMFATLLYRLAGEPAVSGTHPFTDVADGTYYTKAVLWAYQNDVINGTGDGTTFSPDGIVSREQMVTMLYRYAKFAGMDTSASADLSRFSDSASVASWALAGMKWAVAEGLIKGTDAGALLPQGNTDRAQAAAVLVRFVG